MKVNRESLLGALQAVGVAMPSDRHSAGGAVAFHKGRVYASGVEMAASHAVPVDLEVAAAGKEITELLLRMADDEVDILATKTEVLINGAKAKAGVALVVESGVPVRALAKAQKWSPLPAGFTEALKTVLPSVGTDLTKPELGCVHLDEGVVEATDNFRLTRVKVDGLLFKDTLLPLGAAQAVSRFGPESFARDGGWLHFLGTGGSRLSCAVAEGDFPNLKDLAKASGEQVSFTDEASRALGRASVFMDSDKPVCLVRLSNGLALVRGQGPAGWFEETLETGYSGKEVAFYIQPGFLSDMVGKGCKAEVTKNMLKFTLPGFVHCCVFQEFEA